MKLSIFIENNETLIFCVVNFILRIYFEFFVNIE